MQSPRQSENATGAQIIAQGDQAQPVHVPTHTMYQSHHNITRARYITSSDRRGFLPVFEYTINEQPIMMDMDDGYVLWTTIAKALGKTKGDIQRMIENDVDLQPRVRKTKGGYLKTQGTWIPRDHAEGLARKMAWPIRLDLVPLFGPTFPDTCLEPNHPEYEQVGKPHQRKRRNTSAAGATSAANLQARERSNTSYAPGTSWTPPAVPQRGESLNFEPGMGATRQMVMNQAGISQSPPGSFSPQRPQVMPMDNRVQYQSYVQSHPHVDQRQHYSPSSQTPSPIHTALEVPAQQPYSDPSYHQQPALGYGTSYTSGGFAPSPPPLHRSPSNPAYYQQQHQSMQQSQPQQPQYITHDPSQGYSSQPTTPTHTEYSLAVGEQGTYAQHDLSAYNTQSCNTYQQPPQQQSQSHQQSQPSHQQQHQSQQQTFSGAYGSTYASPAPTAYSPGHTYFSTYGGQAVQAPQSTHSGHGASYPTYSYSGGPAESHVRYSAEVAGNGGGGGYGSSGQANEVGQYAGYGYEAGPSTETGTSTGTGFAHGNQQAVQQQQQPQQTYYPAAPGYHQGHPAQPEQAEGSSYGSQTYYSQQYGMPGMQ